MYAAAEKAADITKGVRSSHCALSTMISTSFHKLVEFQDLACSVSTTDAPEDESEGIW